MKRSHFTITAHHALNEKIIRTRDFRSTCKMSEENGMIKIVARTTIGSRCWNGKRLPVSFTLAYNAVTEFTKSRQNLLKGDVVIRKNTKDEVVGQLICPDTDAGVLLSSFLYVPKTQILTITYMIRKENLYDFDTLAEHLDLMDRT